ncbi:MAG: hypothetical protein CSA97_02075 [Bacteroidetes bacterium]|nr:MAG: hypothetical protein CSA97_02075 [Bacteroidota bacterium]
MDENIALIFYSRGTRIPAWQLTHSEYQLLAPLWEGFRNCMGYYPDQYGHRPFELAHMRIMLELADAYAATADLNADRERTKAILAFRGMLAHHLAQGNALDLWWD